MTRILHITSSLEKNGTETFIMNIFRKIKKLNVSFDFLIFSDSQSGFYDEALSLGAKIYSFPPRNKGLLAYYNNIKKFMKDNASKYDAIHFSGCSIMTIIPFIYAKKYGCKRIILHSHSTKHNNGFLYLLTHNLFRKVAVYLSTDFLACSKKAAEWFYRDTKAEKNSIVVNNGIDTLLFSYKESLRLETRQNLGISNDTYVLGSVSRLVGLKNHTFMIDIFIDFNRINPNSMLLLVGDGPMMQELKLKVNKNQLENKVLFLGNQTDINKYLNAMDVFLMTSFYEGVPFSALEAQSTGLNIIASSTITTDIDISGNVAYCDLENKKEWLSTLSNNIKTSALSRNKSVKSFIKDSYILDNIVKQMFDIYTVN